MTPEQERWAEAANVQRLHGDQAPVFVAERLGAMVLAGDMVGLRRWKEIAFRLAQLMALPIQTQ